METITIIIPTLATAERGSYLKDAIDSILSQSGVNAIPMVVANGGDCDAEVLRWLKSHRDVRFLRIDEASMPNALYVGWKSLDTRFFGELDDDDELLPRALSIRLEAFNEAPEIDAVVTNGIVRGRHGDEAGIANVTDVAADPLRSLLKSHWLLPGSTLFNNQRLNDSFFADMPAYLEWTYLALRLSLEYKIKFIPKKTVLHRVDLPFSIDQSEEASIGRAASMGQLLELNLPVDVERVFKKKVTQAFHYAAARKVADGNRKDAWPWHLQSLLGRGGWRYLPYTGKLLLPI